MHSHSQSVVNALNKRVLILVVMEDALAQAGSI